MESAEANQDEKWVFLHKSDDYLVGVHVLEEVEDGGVGEADEADDDVERGEAEHLDDVAGDDGPDGVGRRVRDVRDGVHRPVHAHVFLRKGTSSNIFWMLVR